MPTNNLDTTNIEYPVVFTGINKSDINISPFNAYKRWDFASGSATSSVLPLTAIYSDHTNLPFLGTELTYNDSSNIDGSLQTVTYYSINHLFYKRKDTPFNTFGPSDTNRVKKFLYQSASIFSFPGKKVGLGIKPTSFIYYGSVPNPAYQAQWAYNIPFWGSSTPPWWDPADGTWPPIIAPEYQTCILRDDKYGNVYDTAIDTGSIIKNVMYYEGFNEYFDTTRIKSTYQNITFVPGITITGNATPSTWTAPGNIGLAARFTGNGYMKQDINGEYDREHDFAVSFFISASTQSATKLVLGKLDPGCSRYPFKIELTTDAKIKFTAAASSALTTSITSSALSTDWQHIVCQKSGSKMYLHVNNGTPITASNPAFNKPLSPMVASGYINNSCSLHIGGFTTASSNITADLDEIRIFNKSLSTSNISALNNRSITGSCLQTNIVGNVYHDQGIAIISSPNPIYDTILNVPFTGSYRSTVRLNEFTTTVRIPAGQYNMSLNRSLLKDDAVSYEPFVSSSIFSPYITSIGLYNEGGTLMAIAKLAQPIKKRNDIDLNFLIRIDLDQPFK
jgi:hypothetical protein